MIKKMRNKRRKNKKKYDCERKRGGRERKYMEMRRKRRRVRGSEREERRRMGRSKRK